MTRPALLILVGPTASGKTAVACEIAKSLPVEAVSCDSMQVYRGMPLLTQNPTAAEKKALKTHLVGFLDPSEEYDAALFRRDALEAIAGIRKKKRLPLLTVGTGLYLRALLDGLFETDRDNTRDERYRKKLLREQAEHGGHCLHEKLKKVDPASAAKIHPNDHRRLVRALEVHRLTGRPLSELKPTRRGIRQDFHCRLFFLNRDRADLYRRIGRRVDAMLKHGLLKEARSLARRKPGRTASMALGYREMQSVLDKKQSLTEAAERLKKNTRNYAKRQLSWFRHEKGIEPVTVGEEESPKKVAQRILKMWKDL